MVSVVKTATVREVCSTEEQCSIVRFFSLKKDLKAKDIHK
jgi:hypothetical protein